MTNTDKVQLFLEELKLKNPDKYKIILRIRELLSGLYPDVSERMMYGGIMFTRNEDFGGVFVYKNHISFEFSYGYKLSDPDKVLEGGGKFRRHLKIMSMDDIEAKGLLAFLEQIKALDDE